MKEKILKTNASKKKYKKENKIEKIIQKNKSGINCISTPAPVEFMEYDPHKT